MTNITNEQLEALLEPYPARPTVMGNANASYTNSYSDSYVVSAWEKKWSAIAKRREEAAPALAAALLAERKAREVEVAKLKAAIQDIAENWKWWDEDRYDRCSSVVGDSIAEAEQALKGPTP